MIYVEQMDLIRYSTMSQGAIEESGRNIVDIGRKLAIYSRDEEQAQALLLKITKNMTKKGRLFSKNMDDSIVGGYKTHWQPEELAVLRVALLFTHLYYAVLRYDPMKSLITSPNVQKIHRVYTTMIVVQDFDIIFLQQFKNRNSKSIKEKMRLCGDYQGRDSLLLQIHDILVKNLKYTTSTPEPSTGATLSINLLFNNILSSASKYIVQQYFLKINSSGSN